MRKLPHALIALTITGAIMAQGKRGTANALHQENTIKGEQLLRAKQLVAKDRLRETGVPVCYLDELGDTIIPYGKYLYCQADTTHNINFVIENARDARIVGLDSCGKELFYVFKYDNGPDYISEGLFRITDGNDKIGFANSVGNIVITPQFKFATPFKNGKAAATTNGHTSHDGGYPKFLADKWMIIDRNGNKLLEYHIAANEGKSQRLLITTATGQAIEYKYPTGTKIRTDLTDATVIMHDANFDGNDDILINLGKHGKHMAQHYDCYLWNQQNKRYEKDNSFNKIENPQIDSDERCVLSSTKKSATSYVYKRFEYTCGRFVMVSTLTQTVKPNRPAPTSTEK